MKLPPAKLTTEVSLVEIITARDFFSDNKEIEGMSKHQV